MIFVFEATVYVKYEVSKLNRPVNQNIDFNRPLQKGTCF